MPNEETEGRKSTIEELIDGEAGPSPAKEDETESLPHTLGVMAAEYGARLRQQIEDTLGQKPQPKATPSNDPIAQEFNAVAADIQDTVARVQARLMKMMQQEIRRVFEESLSGAAAQAAAPPMAKPVIERRPIAEPSTTLLQETPEVIADPVEIKDEQPSAPRAEVQAPLQKEKAPTPPANQLALRPSTPRAPVRKAVAPPITEGPEDENYEGTVRLTVESNGSIRQVVAFVDRLAQDPHFRLLKAVGNHRKAGMDVWLGLRETLCLKKVLQEMQGVAEVDVPAGYTPDGHERLVRVRLAEAAMTSQA